MEEAREAAIGRDGCSALAEREEKLGIHSRNGSGALGRPRLP
jgi:hypothetical protein